jgi:hypothetical protein
MLILSSYTGIRDWDTERARRFILENGRIPSGTPNDFMEPLVAIVVAKSLEEHGFYGGRTALAILGGRSAGTIPLCENRRIQMTLNVELGTAAGMVFPLSMLKVARVIRQPGVREQENGK